MLSPHIMAGGGRQENPMVAASSASTKWLLRMCQYIPPAACTQMRSNLMRSKSMVTSRDRR